MSNRSAHCLSVSAAAWLCIAGALSAQDRRSFDRVPQPRVDRTIFSELDLPTPNRYRTGSGAPGPDYWQQEANYRIDVSLDPEQRLVHGKEHVTYVNHSPDTLTFVWLELEQNLLRPDSIGAVIGAEHAVGGEQEPSEGVKLLDVSAGGQALDIQVYDTMGRVTLPEPLAPGETFEFDVTWEFTVPTKVFRRYGTLSVKKGTVWEIAQWFPQLAVYDDVHGWNTLPYLGTGEFYSNYGTYDVAITVPHDHVVVATGVLQNPDDVYTEEQQARLEKARQSEDTVTIITQDEVGTPASRPEGNEPLTWRFHAEKVRTFAWASSEAFMLDAAGYEDTLVQSAYPEDALPAWSKSTQMLRTSIVNYSKRWHPYPYPVATNVSGVEGGMEYPMIIFCRGRSEGSLFGVTTHEIGHNWFPMMVNSDERRHAWMDEGFNTFINIYSSQDYYGNGNGDDDGRSARRRGRRHAMMGRFMAQMDTPIMTEADQLNGMQLGMLEYQKTGDALHTLREFVLGPERFDTAFRTYIDRWAFKSPQPADFFRTMEDASGMDLDWFWRGWFVEAAKLDQAIEAVAQAEGKPARITITNNERMVMPVTFTATLADGSTETHELPVQMWFASDRFETRLESDQPVTKVELDPDRVLPDIDRSNNSWEAKG